jgi:hypothetical protein
MIGYKTGKYTSERGIEYQFFVLWTETALGLRWHAIVRRGPDEFAKLHRVVENREGRLSEDLCLAQLHYAIERKAGIA